MQILKVAVVDDDTVTLKMVSHILETELHAEVFSFKSSSFARDFISMQSPDTLNLIISDQNMPDYDGLSLLEYSNNLGLAIPFILLTGDATKECVAKARKAGVTTFIAKPFTTGDLVDKVKSIVA